VLLVSNTFRTQELSPWRRWRQRFTTKDTKDTKLEVAPKATGVNNVFAHRSTQGLSTGRPSRLAGQRGGEGARGRLRRFAHSPIRPFADPACRCAKTPLWAFFCLFLCVLSLRGLRCPSQGSNYSTLRRTTEPSQGAAASWRPRSRAASHTQLPKIPNFKYFWLGLSWCLCGE